MKTSMSSREQLQEAMMMDERYETAGRSFDELRQRLFVMAKMAAPICGWP